MGNDRRNSEIPIGNHSKNRTQSIAFATLLMIIGLTISKCTGFLREIFIIQKFGSSYLSDSFYLGFQIPDLFYQLLIGGSIQAAITPSLARSLEKGEERRGWRSVSIFISVISLIMLVIVLVGSLSSDFIFPAIYGHDKRAKTIALAATSAKILFPQVFFMMLAALSIGILNAYKKFSSSAFGPTFYNILVVLSIILLGGKTPHAVILTCVGVLLSAFLFFVFQSSMARRELSSFRFSLDIHDEGFRQLLKLAIPTMISASIVQLNTIILANFSVNHFSDGIVTSLNNAKTIWQLPYGIFAVAVGNVMLPSLAGHYASGDHKSARILLGRSLRNALFLTIPSAALLLTLRVDVVLGILNWGGSYSISAANRTASILMGYCIAVVMHTIIFIYNQAFYAIGKTKIPLINGGMTLVLTYAFCLLSVKLSLGAVGLSLAYSLSSVISAIFLSSVYRKNKLLSPKGIFRFLGRELICVAVLLLFVSVLNLVPFYPTSKIIQLAWLFARAIMGMIGYLLCAYSLQMRELHTFLERIMRRKVHKLENNG